MPDATFAANLISGYFDTMSKERDRKEKNSLEAAKFLMSSGRVKDYNDLLPLLGPLVGDQKGGKGGKGKNGKPDPHSILAQFVNPALQGGQGGQGGSGGGQARPGGSAPLFTEDQMQGREEEAKGRDRAAATDDFQKREDITTKGRIAVEEHKPQRGVPDKQATQNQDGSWSIKVRAGDGSGTVVYEQPANAPKKTGPLENRVQELVAQGIPADRAPAVAAEQLQKERQTKVQQAGARTAAYLNMSRASLASNLERYDEMKQTFPYVLASKMAGAEAATLRPELLKLAIDAKGAGSDKAQVDGQKEAAKIVESAAKQAKVIASKKSSILTGLGLEDDEETIRKNLIQEMSGGMDVDKVEALARARTSGAGPEKKPAVQHKVGDVVKTRDGTRHKILTILPGGRLNLDPAPIQ